MMEHLFGILAIVLPFVAFLILALRYQGRTEKNRHRFLEKCANALGSSKVGDKLDFDVSLEGSEFNIGIGHGGESDEDCLYVRCRLDPFPDGVTFIFQQGINRWMSRKLKTGDRRFNSKVCCQVAVYQKHPDRNEFADDICRDADVRQALLDIHHCGFNHVSIPGTWEKGSFSHKLGSRFVSGLDQLSAFVGNPKEQHYDPAKIRRIATALRVVAEHLNTFPRPQ